MILVLEIDHRMRLKPWRNKAGEDKRFGWLCFVFAMWNEPYEKVVMEPHDWIMPDGKRYTSYEQLIEQDGE